MPSPISPILPSSAGSANIAPKASVAAPEQQFQRTLVRQIEQRQALDQTRSQAQASTQAKARADAKAGADAKARADTAQPEPPATPGNADAAREVRPESGAKADAKADAKTDAKADDKRNDVPLDATPQPLSDMLALVASLQQATAGANSAPKASDAEPGTGAAVRSATALPGLDLDTAQADSKAALQSDAALKAQPLELAPKAAVDPTPFAALTALKSAMPDAPLPDTANLVAPTAQAALQIAQTASALPTDKLHGQVGSAAWNQQLGQKVVWMAAGGAQSATLTLNPPDLGPLQVVLNVANDQATISFTSAQPEVRQALEAAMPKLREMMGEAGLNLGNASVSAGTSNQDQASAQQERLRQSGGVRPDSDSLMDLPMPATRGSALQGVVDTFA